MIQGGIGKGTIVEFESSLGHEPQPLTYHIDEPEPGRLLTMTSTNGAIVQTYKIVDSVLGRCEVTFSIRYQRRPGLRGLFDKVAGPMEIERILEQKLDNLELYAATLGATIHGSHRLRELLNRP